MLHLPSMVTYGILSFSMAFLNKALFEVADFRCSLFVILFQLIFVVVAFQLFGVLRLLSVPLLTRAEISRFLIPSIFYCLSTVLSLQALMKLNVAVYVVIKRCTPALTFLLQAIVLKKQKLNVQTGFCVFAITIGAVITSINDLSYHPESYLIGSLSVVFQSLYLLTIQRSGDQKSSSDVLYINSLLSLPMIFVVFVFFTNEMTDVQSYSGYRTFAFWIYFLSSTLGGGLLNGATFWCTINNSALTTSVVGVLKSILQIFFGMFMFDRLAINFNTVVGIMLSLVAGTIFSYLEYKEKKHKSATSTHKNPCDEQQKERSTDATHPSDDMAIHSSKSAFNANDETRIRIHGPT